MAYADNPGSDDDLYGNMPKQEPPKEDMDEETTAVLPKSILAGKEFKVGDEVVLEITHMGEDDVTVKYASEKGEEEEHETTKEEAPMPKGGGEMASMYS